MTARVAMLIPGLDRIGGAERQLLLLAPGMVRMGWQVAVVALSGSGREAGDALRSCGVEFLSLRMKKGWADPRGWWKLERFLRRWRPRIVHTHLPHATWMARWSRLITPVPVLLDSLHTTATGGWTRRFGYRVSRWLTDLTTAVGPAVAEAWLDASTLGAERLAILPNGIEMGRFSSDSAARAHIRQLLGMNQEFLWLAVGRMEAVKDFSTLLRGFAGAANSAHLAIVGNGAEQPALRALAAELQIEERVHFPGFQPEIAPWFAAADAFVSTSLWEGLPMGLLEAGAAGLPAVATDVPGIRDALQDAETGLLVPPRNPEALRCAMNTLMDLPMEKRRAMGADARKFVGRHFRMESVLRQWDSLYNELLARNPQPRRWAGPGLALNEAESVDSEF